MDFSGISILVLGDVMLDYYIAGTADRVSPEAPVTVVSKRRAWTVPGGAANVARGLARLGCATKLIGLIGNDAAGENLKREAVAEGIETGLVVSQKRPTICKTRIMANGQQLLRVDEETIMRPSLEEKIALRLNLKKMLEGCSAVILSDYAKGVLLRDREGHSLCAEAIGMAQTAGLPVLIDPKGADWARYCGAQCVTPNMSEFTKVCDSLGYIEHDSVNIGGDARKRQELAEEICNRFSLERLLLTRGARGMSLYEKNQKPARIRAVMREVADVSGAGDTVIATLAACVAKGLDWRQSAKIANIAAGVAVCKIGTAPVSGAELNQALREGDDNPKLYTRRDLLEKIRDWRRQGQSIVFTNGCFDLLHPGHISLLRQSAAMGDRLVVGLNTDNSVRRLKGKDRPIQNQDSRALLLAALQVVDAVVLFNEDTPEELIQAIKPDYLVKGSDYRIDEIAGSKFVQSYGGQVRLVNIVAGCSTTGIVRQMRTSDACQS